MVFRGPGLRKDLTSSAGVSPRPWCCHFPAGRGRARRSPGHRPTRVTLNKFQRGGLPPGGPQCNCVPVAPQGNLAGDCGRGYLRTYIRLLTSPPSLKSGRTSDMQQNCFLSVSTVALGTQPHVSGTQATQRGYEWGLQWAALMGPPGDIQHPLPDV